MDSILTNSHKGFVRKDGTLFYLSSESGSSILYFYPSDGVDIISVIIAGESRYLTLSQGTVLHFSIGNYNVTIEWITQKGIKESATFDILSLTQLIDVEMVREYVLSMENK
jgi:hypothetical protein